MAHRIRNHKRSLIRLGAALFRVRSFTLVPLAVALLVTPWLVPGDPARSAPLLAVGGILLAAGAAVRFHVSGLSPRGTSTRGTTIGAARLVTSGCYAHCRNPLYVANACLWVGAACLTGLPFLPLAVLAVVAAQYFAIVFAEETYLRRKFGETFDAYCRHVPRFRPRLTPWAGRSEPLPFGWKRAVFKEHDSLFGTAALAVLIVLPSAFRAAPSAGLIDAWYGGFAGLAVVWLAAKALKHQDAKARRTAESVGTNATLTGV